MEWSTGASPGTEMFARTLIESDTFQCDAEGFAFCIRLNWYRALPLSSVGLEVRVDGAPVDKEAITFTIDGHEYGSTELAQQYDRYWFVTDAAGVRVVHPEGLERGAHELSVTLQTRIPYIPTRGTDVLLEENTCVSMVTA